MASLRQTKKRRPGVGRPGDPAWPVQPGVGASRPRVEIGNKRCWKRPAFGAGTLCGLGGRVRRPRECAADSTSSVCGTDVWSPFKPRGARGNAVGAQIFQAEESPARPLRVFPEPAPLLNLRRRPSGPFTSQRAPCPAAETGRLEGHVRGPGAHRPGVFLADARRTLRHVGRTRKRNWWRRRTSSCCCLTPK